MYTSKTQDTIDPFEKPNSGLPMAVLKDKPGVDELIRVPTFALWIVNEDI
jgi:hypothetical protein